MLTGHTPAIEEEEDEAYDSDESFHYPSQSPAASIRAPSIRSHPIDYFGESSSSRPSPSRRTTDLTPQLSQAPEFRVPTHETPQKVRTPTWTPPTAHQLHAQWERDDRVNECRSCKRRFTFYFRKVSCLGLACLEAYSNHDLLACTLHGQRALTSLANDLLLALPSLWKDLLR